MIQLEDNSLSFAFPEIPRQLESLLEQHIQKIHPQFVLPENRHHLVDMLMQFIKHGTVWQLAEMGGKTSREQTTEGTNGRMSSVDLLENEVTQTPELLLTAKALTDADIDAALRKTAKTNARISDAMSALHVSFQRTLRIPDNGKDYPLPASLGEFPVRSVDDFVVPVEWLKRGGVMMPMYQSEALWMRFSSDFPFALKVGAGKINAVSGEPWAPEFQRDPQNYVVVPKQPWLDGFAVGEGVIRQFVAMPLGAGFSVEEQLTSKAEFGGIQLQACPMRVESYFNREIVPNLPEELLELIPALFQKHLVPRSSGIKRSLMRPAPPMGLAAGGLIRQEIYEDPYPFEVWDTAHPVRCFVHLCNSLVWREMTNEDPPHPPLTAKEYETIGFPWFDHYRDDLKALKGTKALARVKTVAQLGKKNEPAHIAPTKIVQYGNTRRPGEIREGPSFRQAPDPEEYLDVSVTRFSNEERTALIEKMKRARKAIASSYKKSPLDALLACLHFHADGDLSGYTANPDGSLKNYILVFMTPPNTWRIHAGQGGFYTVDPKTLKATKFTMTVLN